MIFLRLITIIIALSICILGLFKLRNLFLKNTKLKAIQQKSTANLTQLELANQYAFLNGNNKKKYMLFYRVLLYISMVSCIIFGIFLKQIINNTQLLMLISGFMWAFIALLPLSFYLTSSRNQQKKQQYLVEHPENDLKFFTYPNGEFQDYLATARQCTMFLTIGGLLLICGALI